ncbi:MAG: hypothetical protein ACRDY3_11070 [Acidimicrobiales bacterium]
MTVGTVVVAPRAGSTDAPAAKAAEMAGTAITRLRFRARRQLERRPAGSGDRP